MNCWFCGTKEAESKKAIRLYMYGELQASDAEENKKRIAYSTKIIDVPRCADCKKTHMQAKIANVFIAIMAVVMLASVLAAVIGTWVAQWIWGVALGLSVGFIIMLFVLKVFIMHGAKKISAAKKDYPPVVDLLCEGYKFGKNPSYEESVQTNGNGKITTAEQKKDDFE